jgi:hypothetical protein
MNGAEKVAAIAAAAGVVQKKAYFTTCSLFQLKPAAEEKYLTGWTIHLSKLKLRKRGMKSPLLVPSGD